MGRSPFSKARVVVCSALRRTGTAAAAVAKAARRTKWRRVRSIEEGSEVGGTKRVPGKGCHCSASDRKHFLRRRVRPLRLAIRKDMVAYERLLDADPSWAMSEGSRHFEQKSA